MCLEIGDLAEGEALHCNVIKNDEAMIDRRTLRAGNERWLSRGCTVSVVVNSQRSPVLDVIGLRAMRIDDSEPVQAPRRQRILRHRSPHG